MITVISATNRKDSEAQDFAKFYVKTLSARTSEEVKLLALEEIPHDWFHPDMYAEKGQSPSLARLQDEYMLPAGKFVFVIPEYNGSFPGVLKLFLDACSVRKYHETFKGKKAALLGVASGRAGNLRGMDAGRPPRVRLPRRRLPDTCRPSAGGDRRDLRRLHRPIAPGGLRHPRARFSR